MKKKSYIPKGLCSVIITAVVIYLTLSSNPLDINSFQLFSGFDKLAHFLMYFTVAVVYLYDYTKFKLPHHTTLNLELLLTAFAAVMGLLLEIGQLVLTDCREFEIYDCIANAVGALCGFFVMRFWGIHLLRKYFLTGKHSHRSRHHHFN
ncbi:MAG: VanZ family protein [Sodaliphilus sp.]